MLPWEPLRHFTTFLTTGISQLISPKILAEGWINVSYLGQLDWRGKFPVKCQLSKRQLVFHRKFPQTNFTKCKQRFKPVLVFHRVFPHLSHDISPIMEISRDTSWHFTGNFPHCQKTSVLLISHYISPTGISHEISSHCQKCQFYLFYLTPPNTNLT